MCARTSVTNRTKEKKNGAIYKKNSLIGRKSTSHV